MKPKNKYEEVIIEKSTSIKEIQREFLVHKILTYILIIITIIICLSNLKLTIDNEALREKENELTEIIENLKEDL